MWWTVCSLTQELVNICNSIDVKDEVFKPKGKLQEQLVLIEKSICLIETDDEYNDWQTSWMVINIFAKWLVSVPPSKTS